MVFSHVKCENKKSPEQFPRGSLLLVMINSQGVLGPLNVCRKTFP
jgi:hypothetical protein